MDQSEESIQPDQKKCNEEEKSDWSKGKWKHEHKENIQTTTITIHMLMTPNRIEDKTTNNESMEMTDGRREEMVDLRETERQQTIQGVESDETKEPARATGNKIKVNECRSIGIQTTVSLERFVEGGRQPSDGRETAETNIHSLPREILIKLVDYIPDIKTRFRLRRVCSPFRDLIDAPLIWKSRNELKIKVWEGGWWFCINGCRISGSCKKWLGIFHSYNRLKQNVCQAIRDLLSRISITYIGLVNVGWLTDKDILLTLGHEMLKYEHNTPERRLNHLWMCHPSSVPVRLTEPLLFSIFIPLATSLQTMNMFRNQSKTNLNSATAQAFHRLLKACSRLQSVGFGPDCRVECLEAIRGKPLWRLRLQGSPGGSPQQLADIFDSFSQTLIDLSLTATDIHIDSFANAKLLRTVHDGFWREESIIGPTNVVGRLGGFPNIEAIFLWFIGTISTQSVVTMATTLMDSLKEQQDRDKHRAERRVSLRLRNDGRSCGELWPSQPIRIALEEQGMDVQIKTNNVTGHYCVVYGLDEKFVTWMELRKGSVRISLHCNCNSQ